MTEPPPPVNASQQTKGRSWKAGIDQEEGGREGAKVMSRHILCPSLTRRVMVPI